MDLGLSGTFAIVTGSRGIGYSCAKILLREGATVGLVGRDPAILENAAESLRAGGTVFTAAADLADTASTRVAYEALKAQGGVPEVLICAAGAAEFHRAEEMDADSWRDAFEAKFMTVMNMIDIAKHDMMARGKGAIVPIIGTGGKIVSPFHLAGGAANAALMLAATGLGVTLGRKGLRVVGVSPAATETDRVKGAFEIFARNSGQTLEDYLAERAESYPLGRPADPDEVAEVAVYMASDRASYMNGTVVQADGGQAPAL